MTSSDGDLKGMRVRYPGYVSIVLPDYGAQLPSLSQAHVLMWTVDGFQSVGSSIQLFDDGRAA